VHDNEAQNSPTARQRLNEIWSESSSYAGFRYLEVADKQGLDASNHLADDDWLAGILLELRQHWLD
jgi:DNA mismatch repair protein MutH